MKTFRGIRTEDRRWMVKFKPDGDDRWWDLVHHLKHSPDGHSWGYGGSGPAELAKDILWNLLGYEPEPAMYQAFKDDFVACWPQDGNWVIGERAIRMWMLGWVIDREESAKEEEYNREHPTKGDPGYPKARA